jgi:flotillin
VDSGILPKLAEANAKALQGLNPSISIWRTGSGDDSGKDAFAPITNAMSNLPPLLSQLEKAGIRPPSWLMDASAGKAAPPKASDVTPH